MSDSFRVDDELSSSDTSEESIVDSSSDDSEAKWKKTWVVLKDRDRRLVECCCWLVRIGVYATRVTVVVWL